MSMSAGRISFANGHSRAGFGRAWTKEDGGHASASVKAQLERAFSEPHKTKGTARKHTSMLPELRGVAFGSSLERRRGEYLAIRVREGTLTDLSFHPKVALLSTRTYTADSQYRVAATGEMITEEVKHAAWKVDKKHSRFHEIIHIWIDYGPWTLRIATWDKDRGWHESDILVDGRGE